jgi:hypothetical protein
VTSTAVKSASVTSTAVKSTTEARVPAGGKAPRRTSMIEAAERARMSASLEVRRSWSVERGAAMESGAAAIEMVVIDERAAV